MMRRLRPLSRDEVRTLDNQAAWDFALPTIVLMENAGRGAAVWLAELAAGINPVSLARECYFATPEIGIAALNSLPRVLILCGPGNNGGDGGVVARYLDAWGFPVRVIWFAHPDQLRGDARTQWLILEQSGIDQAAWHSENSVDSRSSDLDRLINDAHWLVDGLLGTGLTRSVEGVLRVVIESMNGSGKPILALDLPSGLDTDTGLPLGVAVKARATATFVAPKLGFSQPGTVTYTGEIAVIDIGLPRCLLKSFEL